MLNRGQRRLTVRHLSLDIIVRALGFQLTLTQVSIDEIRAHNRELANG